MKVRFLLICVSAILFATELWAQNEAQDKTKGKFRLNGEFRTTAEYRDGYAKPLLQDDEVPASVIRSRVRFTAQYEKTKFETKLTLQDARAWGSNYSLKEEGYEAKEGDMYENPLHIYEAWAQYNVTPRWGIRLGRQELRYAEGRILWHRRWRDQGFTHDALLVRYQKEKTEFHIGASKSSSFMTKTNGSWAGTSFQNDFGLHKHMALVFFTTELTEGLTLNFIDFMFTKQGPRSPEHTYAKNTVGGNLLYKSPNIESGATFYYQQGTEEGNAAEREVSARMFNVNAAYKISGFLARAAYDYYSGQKKGEEKKTVFDMVYGGRHRFTGRIDYYSAVPTFGLTDLYFQTGYNFGKKAKILISYHMFSATEEITGLDSKSYGSELDIECSAKLAKEVSLKMGYSFYLPNDGTRIIKKIDPDADLRFANFGWAMIIFKPKFLN